MVGRPGISLLLAIAAVGGVPQLGRAQNPYPYVETFENDVDAYDPSADPFGNPIEIDGLPPGDWQDIRVGPDGLIEEVSSGYLGVTASHGGHLGVIYPFNSTAPFSNSGYSVTPPATPLAFRIDLYVDPAMQSALAPGTGQELPDGRPGVYGSDGLADFCWIDAVNRVGGGQLTDTGFSGEVLDNGAGSRFWRFTPTGDSAHGVDVPVGQWITLEVAYDTSATLLAATRRVWNQKHTQLLFTSTVTDMFGSPSSADMGGARFSWFTDVRSNGNSYPGLEPNIARLFVDDAGVTTPIVEIVLGDMDGNGRLDNFDIQPFELALTDPDAYLAAFPPLTDYPYRGDADGNNQLDNFDIQPFEDLLTSGSALSGPAVPEPATLVLAMVGISVVAASRIVGRRRGPC